jgi:hypothetical protein
MFHFRKDLFREFHDRTAACRAIELQRDYLERRGAASGLVSSNRRPVRRDQVARLAKLLALKKIDR